MFALQIIMNVSLFVKFINIDTRNIHLLYKGPGECWEHLLEAFKDALVVCFDAADYQHPFRLDYEYFEALATRLGWNDVTRVDVLPLRVDGICVLHLEADQVLKPVIGIVSPSSLPNLHQPGPGFGGPGPYGDSASQVVNCTLELFG
jgi:hypothetical protein